MRFLLLTVAVGCGQKAPPEAVAPSFPWPPPAGWRTETIPFPLDFAPDIPYHGVEELRFAPDFFEPQAPTFFTYAFVWWLEGTPDLGETSLERDLVSYFSGLSMAVGRKKYTFDPAHFRADLTPGDGGTWQGRVETYDPFVTGAELGLNVEIAIRDCPADRRAVLALASPRPRPDPVWDGLDGVAAAFGCP